MNPRLSNRLRIRGGRVSRGARPPSKPHNDRTGQPGQKGRIMIILL